ncbi:MAG: tRNA pseudouridine(38-40) synthase TruA [Bacteroidota bacterium]|nr:tRNA pseudouridine(38-40) synthase TruA [Bacteroidota bacterium]
MVEREILNNIRYFIRLSYDGSKFHGWQSQKNSETIQELLNKTFSLVLKKEIYIIGAGRTDQGVHAKNYYAHFDTDTIINNIDDLIYKLNSFLPADIVIHEIFRVKPNIHSRFDAISRKYMYQITLKKNPFLNNYSYYLYGEKPDLNKMNYASDILYEYEDFSCFSKSKTQTKTNLCKIIHAEWKYENDLLIFTITANRFLRNMVRAIVGTMLNIGKGVYDADHLHDIIKSKNRSNAGLSVPAHALFLIEIKYPDNIRIED